MRKQLKGCATRVAGHYCFPSQKCGCSSVVEHLLAKEDVASSSLVTRSMSFFDIAPSRDEFRELAKRGNLVPLIVDLVADVETPVSTFAKIDNGQPCFLFESAERNEELGRFSFIGFDPLVVFNSAECEGDPLTHLQQTLERFKFVPPRDVP